MDSEAGAPPENSWEKELYESQIFSSRSDAKEYIYAYCSERNKGIKLNRERRTGKAAHFCCPHPECPWSVVVRIKHATMHGPDPIWSITELSDIHLPTCTSEFKMSIRDLAKEIEKLGNCANYSAETIMNVLEQRQVNHGGRLPSIYAALRLLDEQGKISRKRRSIGSTGQAKQQPLHKTAARCCRSDQIQQLWKCDQDSRLFLMEEQALLYCAKRNAENANASFVVAEVLKLSLEGLKLYNAQFQSIYTYSKESNFMSERDLFEWLES